MKLDCVVSHKRELPAAILEVFSEAALERKEFNKAVHLMNEYITGIALPFIEERLHPPILTRIANAFSASTLPDAAETLREWQTSYEKWNEQQGNKAAAEWKTLEEAERMKKIFITLYTLSFSPKNFPPVAVEPSY